MDASNEFITCAFPRFSHFTSARIFLVVFIVDCFRRRHHSSRGSVVIKIISLAKSRRWLRGKTVSLFHLLAAQFMEWLAMIFFSWLPFRFSFKIDSIPRHPLPSALSEFSIRGCGIEIRKNGCYSTNESNEVRHTYCMSAVSSQSQPTWQPIWCVYVHTRHSPCWPLSGTAKCTFVGDENVRRRVWLIVCCTHTSAHWNEIRQNVQQCISRKSLCEQLNSCDIDALHVEIKFRPSSLRIVLWLRLHWAERRAPYAIYEFGHL